MKILFRIFFFLNLIGIIMIVSGLLMKPNFDTINQFMTDQQTYGDLLIYEVNDDVDKVILDVDHKNIILTTHEKDSVVIAYYQKENDLIDVSFLNHDITFIHENGFNINHGFSYKFPDPEFFNVYLYLPKTVTIDLDITVKNGYIINDQTENVLFDKVNIRLDQGEVLLGYFQVEDMNINIDQGFIYMKSFQASRFSIGMKHEDATILGAEIDRLMITSENGNVDIEDGTYGSIKIISERGDINLINVNVRDSIDLISTEGHMVVDTSETKNIQMLSDKGHLTVSIPHTSLYRMMTETTHGYILINEWKAGSSFSKENGIYDLEMFTIHGDIKIMMKS